MFDSIVRDLTFARRSLARTPIVTATAVISISLGVSATCAVVGVVDAALFRPPPLDGADRLAVLYITRARPGFAPEKERWSWPRTRLLARLTTSFEHVASFSSAVLTLTGDAPEPVNAEIVSSSYWATLHVQPILGRSFAAHEDLAESGSNVAILGYDLWQRRFGGDQGVVGKTVRVQGAPLIVVGVVARGFHGLTGRASLWIPPSEAPELSYRDYLTTNQNFISMVARLGPGVSIEAARAELAQLGPVIQADLPSETTVAGTRFSATAVPLPEARIDQTTRGPLMLLLAAACCLLTLSCANVAGLLLSRALSRRREIAIRVATGASHARIIRQLLVEAGVLSMAGGALGVLMAMPITAHLVLPSAAARGRNFYGAIGEFAEPHMDVRVLAFAFALSAVTAVAFGLLPALRASQVDLIHDLKDGGHGAAGVSRARARQVAVALETALAVVLLFSGGLLFVSWRRLATTHLGFDPSHVVMFWIRPSEVRYPPAKAPALIDQVLAHIQRVPGVQAASVDGCAPVGPGCANSTLYIAGRPIPAPGDAPVVLRHYVGPEHFRTLRIPILRGREFDSDDRAGRPRVAIISERAALRFWPGQDPIGQSVWFGGGSGFDRPDSSATIIGIVGDVAYQRLDDQPFQPDFYTPYAQFTYAARAVMVRTRGDPSLAVNDIRNAVRAAEPNLALFDVRTMEDHVTDSWARLSYELRLVAGFAVIALLLAAMGIFAVIVHAIGDRQRELAVRIALGANHRQVLETIGRHGARPAVAGLAAGLIVAGGVGHVVASLVFGAPAFDVTLVASVIALVIGVIVATVYLAGRRALTIEAASVLREP